ncbi:MAG: transposase [Saprospiraceae bacterium]
MENKEFDFEAFKAEAMERLKAGKGLLGTEGAFTPLIKSFLEEALEGELEAHIAEEDLPNRKNGKGKKTVRTTHGQVEIDTPRDRAGSFDPKVLAKRQKQLPSDIERQSLTLYGLGRLNFE